MFKRAICCFVALGIALSALFCGFTVNAATDDGDITIATASSAAGGEVIVPITIENNPGIMAITISITYDSSVLEYVEFYKGDILKDYMVVAHPDKNIIRFVCCETRDRTGDGTLLSLKFNIAKDAKVGLYKIDISYNKGDFCNWNLERLMPSVTPGGVNVVGFGDADCNGKVDCIDLIALRKWLLAETAAEPPKYFDTDNDGEVNIRDLMRLKRYLAGEDVQLGG